MELKVGQKLKRKFEDFDIVTVTKINGDTVTITDKNGFKHPLSLAKMQNFFEEPDVEDLITKLANTESDSTDDPMKHNIAGPMNRPSRDQEYNKDK